MKIWGVGIGRRYGMWTDFSRSLIAMEQFIVTRDVIGHNQGRVSFLSPPFPGSCEGEKPGPVLPGLVTEWTRPTGCLDRYRASRDPPSLPESPLHSGLLQFSHASVFVSVNSGHWRIAEST